MRLNSLFLATALLAGPAFAQEQDDPLAPLEQAPPAQQPTAGPIVQPLAPPLPPRVIPKDWRGIFSAIDSGDWEGARLGIETAQRSGRSGLSAARSIFSRLGVRDSGRTNSARSRLAAFRPAAAMNGSRSQ